MSVAVPIDLRAAGTIRVTTAADEATWSGLAAAWDDLLRDSASDGPFLTWDWLQSWWMHLRGRAELSVRCVWRGDELIGAVPLAVFPPEPRRGFPTRTLQFLGSGDAGSDYLDVIARHDAVGEVQDALAGDLARESLPIVLGGMRLRPCVAMGLVWRLEARGWRARAARTSICPVADIAGATWETYLGGLGSEHRYAVRRAGRSLEARFDVRHETVRTETRRRQVMEILATLHQRRWRGVQADTAFKSGALGAFHDEASRRFLRSGALRLSLLSVDGWPVAAIYAVRHGDATYFYQSGFDPAFSRWSVGVVAMAASIREAIDEGAAAYDFLHGAERYKFHWTRRFRRLRTLELYPPGRRGRLALRAGALIRRAKAVARAVVGRR